MKIFVAGVDGPHFTKSAGYHQLYKHIECEYIDSDQVPFSKIERGKRGKGLNFIFLDIISKKKSRNFDILHYLYGEYICRIPSLFRNKKRKFIVSIHLDIEKWINVKNPLRTLQKKALEQADGIIVLSSSQKKIAEKIFPKTKVEFIPHGFNPIDSNRYLKFEERDYIKIIVSGSMYRDWEFLMKVVHYGLHHNKKWEFNLVGSPKKQKDTFKDYDNVIVHPYLSDEDYFSLFGNCNVNFLPVTFATANNTLLESQYLGIPSILPKMDGISDYAHGSNFFYSGLEEVVNYLDNIKWNKENADILINYAHKFNWGNIANRIIEFYKNVIN